MGAELGVTSRSVPPSWAAPGCRAAPRVLRRRQRTVVSPPAVSAGRGWSGPVTVQGLPVVVASGVPACRLCGATRTCPRRAVCGCAAWSEGLRCLSLLALLGRGLLARGVPVTAEALGAGRACTVASAPCACFERAKEGTSEWPITWATRALIGSGWEPGGVIVAVALGGRTQVCQTPKQLGSPQLPVLSVGTEGTPRLLGARGFWQEESRPSRAQQGCASWQS